MQVTKRGETTDSFMADGHNSRREDLRWSGGKLLLLSRRLQLSPGRPGSSWSHGDPRESGGFARSYEHFQVFPNVFFLKVKCRSCV